MSLSYFAVENYKAFQNATLKLRPLTILVGANNSGKSSLLKLLLAIQNTFVTSKRQADTTLVTHGPHISLGQNKNLFRNRDISTPIKISLRESASRVVQFLIREVRDSVDRQLSRAYVDLIQFTHYENVLTEFEKKQGTEIDFSSQHFRMPDFGVDMPELNITSEDEEDYIEKIKDMAKMASELKRARKPLMNQFRKLSFIAQTSLDKTTVEDILRLQKTIKATRGIAHKFITITFTMTYREDTSDQRSSLRTSAIELKSEDSVIIKVDADQGTVDSNVFGDDVLTDAVKSTVLANMVCGRTMFDVFRPVRISLEGKEGAASLTAAFLVNLVANCLQLSGHNFRTDSLNYVGPLRASPKRFYYLERVRPSSHFDTSSSEDIVRILRENPRHLVSRINKWMGKFDVKVSTNTISELIDMVNVSSSDSGEEYELTDVGFGISQVLPVIIQCLHTSDDSLTLIEQPEVHLHPTSQALLGDFFIDVIKTNEERKLLIETHSEYLLLRLRRRIAEGALSSDQLGIYFVDHEGHDESNVREIDVLEEGSFDWPPDFSHSAEDIEGFLLASLKSQKGDES